MARLKAINQVEELKAFNLKHVKSNSQAKSIMSKLKTLIDNEELNQQTLDSLMQTTFRKFCFYVEKRFLPHSYGVLLVLDSFITPHQIFKFKRFLTITTENLCLNMVGIFLK